MKNVKYAAACSKLNIVFNFLTDHSSTDEEISKYE